MATRAAGRRIRFKQSMNYQQNKEMSPIGHQTPLSFKQIINQSEFVVRNRLSRRLFEDSHHLMQSASKRQISQPERFKIVPRKSSYRGVKMLQMSLANTKNMETKKNPTQVAPLRPRFSEAPKPKLPTRPSNIFKKPNMPVQRIPNKVSLRRHSTLNSINPKSVPTLNFNDDLPQCPESTPIVVPVELATVSTQTCNSDDRLLEYIKKMDEFRNRLTDTFNEMMAYHREFAETSGSSLSE